MNNQRAWRRGVRPRVLTATLFGALAALVAPPAALANHTAYSVPENKLGYSACAWPAAHQITVSVDETYPFPDASFSARIDDAIGRWNQVLATSNRAMGMVRTTGPADVLLQYRPLEELEGARPEDSNQAIAEVYLQRDGETEPSRNIARCPDRRPRTFTLTAAYVRISPRNDWYTGTETELGMWEMCADPMFQPSTPAACEDSVDFGTTIVHELGHGLAVYHPQTLDLIDGIDKNSPDSATNQAACGEVTMDFDAQSTMCDGQTLYDADGRSLETWDVETVHRLYS